MSEQEKKQQRIYDLLDGETKSDFLCIPYTKQSPTTSIRRHANELKVLKGTNK